MPARLYLAAIGAIVMACLMLQVSIVGRIDPFNVFGGAPKLWWHHWDSRWRTPGIIRGNPDLKIVTVGSSMSEGFLPGMFGVEPNRYLNIAFPGATIEEEAKAVDFLLARATPKIVIWELHPNAFVRGERTGDRTDLLPTYLYGDTIADRIRYLLSPGAFSYVPDHLKAMKRRPKIDADTVVTWPRDPELYGSQMVITQVCRQQRTRSQYAINDPLILGKLRAIVLPIIHRHPNTEFRFFMPGFPDLWYWMIDRDSFSGLADTYATLASEVDAPTNSAFFSMMDASFISDWSHYKDPVHHDALLSAMEADIIMHGRPASQADIKRQFADLSARLPSIAARFESIAPPDCARRLTR